MTDTRRTILWVVFLMSLVLLWDAWGRHNGQPTLFGSLLKPPATASAVKPAAPTPASTVATGVPSAVPVASGAAPAAALPATPAALPMGQQVTLTTDVVKATFDSQGGSLVRLELLGYEDDATASKHVVLFDQSAQRLYVAQTGLVSNQAGIALPNHLTQMTVAPGDRTLAPGAKALSLRFESPLIDGHKLVKTYTLQRGAYTVGVKHEFVNEGSTAVSPQLYLQLARDGNIDGGVPGFMSPASTFTGPAMYTEARFSATMAANMPRARHFCSD